MRLSAVFAAVLFVASLSAEGASLSKGSFTLDFDSQGCPATLSTGSETYAYDCSREVARVDLGVQSYFLTQSSAIIQRPDAVGVAYLLPSVPALVVSIGYELVEKNGVTSLARHVSVKRADGGRAIPSDLTLVLSYGVAQPTSPWIPKKEGLGLTVDLSKTEVAYRAASKVGSSGLDLAMPLTVSERFATFADPYFSTIFDATSIRWTYAKEVGLEDGVESRRIYTTFLSEPDLRKRTNLAIDAFYATVLADVPAGQKWLHEIAMVSYDYMSDGGRGWKNDIDVLAANVPLSLRGKILLTLHGWYDFDGRFAYTPGAKNLDSSWPSFRPQMGRLTPQIIRERIKYAKDLGFKVAIYYGNGMNSASSPRIEIARDPKHILRRLAHGWAGPDMDGSKAVVLNPSHPDVFQQFIDLAKAEMNAWGDLLDAYVWDETFYVAAGDLGTAEVPGYADRAMMRLTKAIARTIHARHPNAAFLTSDDMGVIANVPPYALFADGTYQDANVKPINWSYAIFPNYRNAVFNCNWTGKTAIDKMEFGVRHYQAPVVFTNGWADDYGLSEMSPSDLKRYLDLFQWRSRFSTKLEWMDQLPVYTP